MPTASITAARGSQAGISAAPRSACSAWPVPHPDPAAALVAVGLACLAAGAPLDPQACREPHYRWTLKTDSALAAVAPVVTSVSAILSDWAPPNLGARDRCAHRSGDHHGAVPRIAGGRRRRARGAGRLHASPRRGWSVGAHPRRQRPTYSPRYARARAALDSVIGNRKVRRGGVLARPARARITGAAFFDGQHRRGGRHSDRIDGGHGRCNSSVRALWELHPVYGVASP